MNEFHLQIFGLSVSALALGVAALNAHVILRSKLDLERFKNEMLALLDARYLRREEASLIVAERDRWRLDNGKRLDTLESELMRNRDLLRDVKSKIDRDD